MEIDLDSALTPQQILERFQRLFNRDMTAEERRMFFLTASPSDDIRKTKPQ
jgi:hypothetical protein